MKIDNFNALAAKNIQAKWKKSHDHNRTAKYQDFGGFRTWEL
jgi:hypothetical protein